MVKQLRMITFVTCIVTYTQRLIRHSSVAYRYLTMLTFGYFSRRYSCHSVGLGGTAG